MTEKEERDAATIAAVSVAIMAIISEKKDGAQMMREVTKSVKALKAMPSL